MGIINRFYIRRLKARLVRATEVAEIDGINGQIRQRETIEEREQYEREGREAFKRGEKVEAMAGDWYKWKGKFYGPFPFS